MIHNPLSFVQRVRSITPCGSPSCYSGPIPCRYFFENAILGATLRSPTIGPRSYQKLLTFFGSNMHKVQRPRRLLSLSRVAYCSALLMANGSIPHVLQLGSAMKFQYFRHLTKGLLKKLPWLRSGECRGGRTHGGPMRLHWFFPPPLQLSVPFSSSP